MSVVHQPIQAGHIFELLIVVVPLAGLALLTYLGPSRNNLNSWGHDRCPDRAHNCSSYCLTSPKLDFGVRPLTV